MSVASSTPAVDLGRGYISKAAQAHIAADIEAARLAAKFYGGRFPAVAARALHVHARRHDDLGPFRGVFAFLHRLVEETDATIADLRASDLPEDAVTLIDAVSPRAGETPKQTAMRAVAHPQVAELIVGYGSDMVLVVAPQTPGDWWPTDPDAWQILAADRDRRKELAEQQRKATRYELSLPGAKLNAAGVPVDWANAVAEAFEEFTRNDVNDIGRRRGRHYNARRVQRLDAAQHLIDCYQAEIAPEQYRLYVAETHLTWKQIPAWHNAGLTPELAAKADRRFDRDPKIAAAAVEATGSVHRAGELFSWARDAASDEPSDPRGPICQLMRWWPRHPERDEKFSSVDEVVGVWELLVAQAGSVQQARRRLDLQRIVPAPEKVHEHSWGERRYPDWKAQKALVARWYETDLPAERIELLIAAGVVDPDEAVGDETRALSDEQLQMVAALNA